MTTTRTVVIYREDRRRYGLIVEAAGTVLAGDRLGVTTTTVAIEEARRALDALETLTSPYLRVIERDGHAAEGGVK